jgi:hypothetical protein
VQGFAAFAHEHLYGLVPISAEQPWKVQAHVQQAIAPLLCPEMYARVLASGSNWAETQSYVSGQGHIVNTAEEDLMHEKLAFFFDRKQAQQPESSEARQAELTADRAALAADLGRARVLQAAALAQGAKLPDFASDPERWPGYLKHIGRDRRVPWNEAADREWLSRLDDGDLLVQVLRRKLAGGDFYFRVLVETLRRHPDSLFCAETNSDVRFGVGVKTVAALQRLRSGDTTLEQLRGGGLNLLGNALNAV